MVIVGADELKADIKAVLFQRQFHFVKIGKGQIFKRHYQNCLSKLYLMIIGQFKCLNNFIKYGMNLQKLHLVIRAVQIFRLYHQNCLIFEKISARHNSRSSKILFVIIGEGQIFKSHQENCPISAKILPRDDRASSIFQ